MVNSQTAEPAIWRNVPQHLGYNLNKVLDIIMIMTILYLNVLTKSRASSRGKTWKTSVIHLVRRDSSIKQFGEIPTDHSIDLTLLTHA